MSRSRRDLLRPCRPIAIAFGLVCVLLASTPPVDAQTRDDAPQEASGLTLRDLNRISVEIEELEGSLDDQTRLGGLRSRLAEVEDWYGRHIEGGLVATRIPAMDRALIEELLLVLLRRRTEVAELGRDLDRAIEEVGAIHAAILSRSGAWSQARADFAAEMPDEVAELVDALDDKVVTARGEADRRLGELVALQGEVLDASGRIQRLVASAKERRREIHADVLRRDERPIWALLAATDTLPVREDLEAAGQNVVRAFGDLEDAYADRLVLHGVLAILLLAFVVGLRRSSSLRQHTEFAAAQRALARPLPLTAVLSLALTQPFYTTAQPAVVTVNTVLFIAAELIVLHAVTQRLSASSLWRIGSFLILARLSDLLPFASVSHRIAVLLIGAGGIALMIAARRLLRTTDDFRVWRWRRATEASMVVATAMLAVAVIGNAVGAFSLAVYLTQGITRSLLSGVGLITLAILLRDLLGLGLVAGPLRRLRSIRLHAATVQLRLRSLIAVVGVVFWLWATLAAFGGLDVVVAAIGWILGASIRIGETSITPGTVLIFGIAVWIAVCVSRMTRFFLDEDVLPRLSLPRGVQAQSRPACITCSSASRS